MKYFEQYARIPTMTERRPVLFDQEKEAFVRSFARIEGLRRKTELFKEGPARKFWERLVSNELAGRMDVYQYGYTSTDLYYDQFREPDYQLNFMNVIWFYFDGNVHFRILREEDGMSVLSYITLNEAPSAEIQQAFFGDPRPLRFGEETLITPDMRDFPEQAVREFEKGLP